MPTRGRPYVYQSEDERPVTISVKLPRDLYVKLERYATIHRQTISELVRDGLEWRLELDDPRQQVARDLPYYDDTVLQELQKLIDERVQAALGAQRTHLQANPTAQPSVPHTSTTPHYDNSVLPEKAARHRGRPGILRQPILDCLQDHPEGLTAIELKVYLKTEKTIGDTLAGMVKNGLLKKSGTGHTVRYVVREDL